MSITDEISENLQKGRLKAVKELVQKAIDEGEGPEKILNDGLMAGMNVIGEKFKNNEVYVPEVLVAARAMNAGVQLLKPLLIKDGVKAKGRVCIGTVRGDLHDIGKNLVKMMMEGKGLEVIDLGTDVAPEADVVTLTAADRTTEGLVFDGWTCTVGNVTFTDASAATTTFTMPAADVEITANYREQGPTTGLDAVTAEPLAIYPNPATSYIHISGDQGTPYAIYSITGKVVAQGTLTGETIPVADLSNGLYVVKAGDQASRFVKE